MVLSATNPTAFLHGADGEIWSPLLDALSADHRVIAPEHPGFGRAKIPGWMMSTGDLAFFYLDLLALAFSLYGLSLLVQQGVVSSGDATAVVAKDQLVSEEQTDPIPGRYVSGRKYPVSSSRAVAPSSPGLTSGSSAGGQGPCRARPAWRSSATVITLTFHSVNQRLPSGPSVIP